MCRMYSINIFVQRAWNSDGNVKLDQTDRKHSMLINTDSINEGRDISCKIVKLHVVLKSKMVWQVNSLKHVSVIESNRRLRVSSLQLLN